MAFCGLKVPHETARLLAGLEVPGKKEPTSHFHVTLFFFGDEVDIDKLAEITKVTYGVTSETKPLTVRTSQLTSFPAGDDGRPIICRVESDALHDLRDKIKEAYEAAGVEFSNKHPDYKPHVTLAYDPEPTEDFEEQRIPTVEWGAHELVLWGGDSGDDKLIVTFPFALGAPDKAAARVAQRYLAARVAP
jgi:2'-5' RNA ligase